MGLRYEYIYISKPGPGIFFSLLALLYQPDHYFLGWCGGDWEISPQKWCTAKTENKVVQMEMGRNIKQVLLLSLVGFFMLKISCSSYCPPNKLCTTEMWGINFMRCPRKFPTCICNDVSNNNISRYPICFSLGCIKEQLNRLTAWPSSFRQKCDFLTVYCVTLPQKERTPFSKRRWCSSRSGA